jgi:hypothetical protein
VGQLIGRVTGHRFRATRASALGLDESTLDATPACSAARLLPSVITNPDDISAVGAAWLRLLPFVPKR